MSNPVLIGGKVVKGEKEELERIVERSRFKR